LYAVVSHQIPTLYSLQLPFFQFGQNFCINFTIPWTLGVCKIELNQSLANLDSPDTDEIMLLIGEAISCMSRDRSLSLEFVSVNFPHPVSTQRRGRLSFEIKNEQLVLLLEQGFKVPTITQLLCVSTQTIERQMAAYSLSVSGMKYYCHYIEIIFYSCE